MTWYGWAPPTWVWWVLLGVIAGTVGLLGIGPQPQAVTRWGWAWWVTLTPPLGPIGYLLLSGVSAGRSWDGSDRRAGGGLSFFLALVAGCAVGATINATG